MKIAIYALSADPITYGHINIVRRALTVFDKILVAIGNNQAKKYMFALAERERLAKLAFTTSDWEGRVEVRSFEGLLVDFAFEQGITTIIRGVRNTTDFAFEQMLNDVNQSQRLGVDTHILIADQNLSHVSSSAVKELQANSGKNILEYVPLAVKQALEIKMSKQYRVGITGPIGAGKSYVSKKLREIGKDIKHINVDDIGRYIVTRSEEPIDVQTREKLAKNLKLELPISLEQLTDLIFSNHDALKTFNEIMQEPIFLKLRRRLFGLEGLILIESAIFAETHTTHVVNNNVILVHAPNEVCQERLRKRYNFLADISDERAEEEIKRRVSSQFSVDEKRTNVNIDIDKSGYGTLIEFYNYETKQKDFVDLLLKVEKLFDNRLTKRDYGSTEKTA